ncbi:MAG: methyltransferase domain-containing protein [Candidatus Thermoplasmatota archaeon]
MRRSPVPKEKIAKRYDRWSRCYDAIDTCPLFGGTVQKRWKREAINALGIERGERVLDMGTGTGLIVPWILEKGAGLRVVGIDLSRRMLLRAHARAMAAEMVQGDLEQMPFKDGAFDKIIATFTLTTVPDPVQCLRETARVLRKGGKVAVLDTGPPKKGLTRLFYPLLARSARLSGYTMIDRNPKDMIERAKSLIIETERRFFSSCVYLLVLRKGRS